MNTWKEAMVSLVAHLTSPKTPRESVVRFVVMVLALAVLVYASK